ncbi:MAG: hypothetical protein LBJ45_00145 [Holosporaceae bacterium]|nr:hypothetical protein [Holosporaceae bacterium]
MKKNLVKCFFMAAGILSLCCVEGMNNTENNNMSVGVRIGLADVTKWIDSVTANRAAGLPGMVAAFLSRPFSFCELVEENKTVGAHIIELLLQRNDGKSIVDDLCILLNVGKAFSLCCVDKPPATNQEYALWLGLMVQYGLLTDVGYHGKIS